MNPLIRAQCTQLGLAVDASMDGGETWVCVQLTRYKERTRQNWNGAQAVINPALDRAEYFAALDARGVKYTEVKGDD